MKVDSTIVVEVKENSKSQFSYSRHGVFRCSELLSPEELLNNILTVSEDVCSKTSVS